MKIGIKRAGNILKALAVSLPEWGRRPAVRRFRRAGDAEGERKKIAEIEYRWSSRLFRTLKLNVQVEGSQNLPDQPCVVIANHQSYFDVPCLLYAFGGRQLSFIADARFQRTPLIGSWIRYTKGLFIERGNTRESIKTLQEAGRMVKDGFSVAIFPEGTRSKGKPMKHFKAGSFKLATKGGFPILPAVLDGSWRFYEEKGYAPAGASCKVTFLPVVETKDLSREEKAGIHLLIENQIRKALGEEERAES